MSRKKKLNELLSEWVDGPLKMGLGQTKERKAVFQTESGIKINPLYTPVDLEGVHFDYTADLGFPGQYPFTRGKDPTGYRSKFWIFQQYAGFGDAEDANRRYRFLLDHGQTGISIALDLPTQIGINSDHPLAKGEVGKVGVAIDSLEDLEIMFKGIPLNRPLQISLVANSMALVGLAMFIALAEKQGVPTDKINFRVQNDVLKEFIARGTYIYPPKESLRLATDVITYCAEYHPNWAPLTACGYHIREAGATASQEIAFTIANAFEYMDEANRRGYSVENILPKISVFMSVNMDFFEEIAKFRALRRLWARAFKERYDVKDVGKLGFNLVNFTAGSTLTAQQPMNNIVRVTIECLAGILGGCQSLFPCSMDEAYCTPTEEAVKLALRTQQIIAQETGIADTADPLGGSYYLESLTSSLENKAKKYLDQIEKLGGAIEAINNHYYQKEIADASYKRQREIENKEKIVVGVNDFIDGKEAPIEIFRPPVDTAAKQISKLKRLYERRNTGKVQEILREIKAMSTKSENLVPIVVEAVRRYATLGEICDVFRQAYGEHRETDV